MKYIKENRELLNKYLLILMSNILIYILCSYYFRTSKYIYVYVLFINIIFDMIIYYYNGTIKFKVYLDFILNIIISLILLSFINNIYDYYSIVFSLVFSNNIIFMRSRYRENIFIKSLQYLMIMIYSLIVLFIAGFIYLLT